LLLSSSPFAHFATFAVKCFSSIDRPLETVRTSGAGCACACRP
jgi:hypothetical protein